MKQFVRLILENNNKYLLIKEIKGNWYNAWNFPGGKVDFGEIPEIAALRELKEEINLDEVQLDLLYKTKCVFNNEPWQGFYFICSKFNIEHIKVMEPQKCDGYCFFSFNELKKLQLGIPDDVISKLERYNSDTRSL